MNGGGAEREGDTESEAGSRLRAISPEPDAGLELTDREIVTWAEAGRSTDWATQAPHFFFNVYFWQRERERERERAWAGRGRERGRQNLKQARGSELSAQSPMPGLNSQTARSWPELKPVAELTEPPRHPLIMFLFLLYSFKWVSRSSTLSHSNVNSNILYGGIQMNWGNFYLLPTFVQLTEN